MTRHKIYNRTLLKLSFALFIGLFTYTEVSAQKEILNEAESCFKKEFFVDALQLYNQVPNIKDKDYLLHKAICLIETNSLTEAETAINELVKNDSKNPEFLFYRAYLFQQQESYDLALNTYKTVLRQSKSKAPIKLKAREYLRKCRTAQKISYQTELAFTENLGSDINTKYNDFGAIQSPNFPNLIYFNSDRNAANRVAQGAQQKLLTSDMFSFQFNSGAWSLVPSFGKSLNSHLAEQIFGFPPNGSCIIYSHADINNVRKININHFEADSLSENIPLYFNSKIKAELGDDYIQVFSDSVFLYSSLRTEGLGGYDIFIISLKNGNWDEPIHFRNKINTNYNEICPFLTRDGKQLFFSSDRPESIGGYDIFMSEFNETTKQWTGPKNLGFPINSIYDDLYFKLDNNANSANFSSNRNSGYGGLDLYIAYLKEKNTHHTFNNNEIPFLTFIEEQQKAEKLAAQQKQEITPDKILVKENASTIKLKPLFFNSKDRLVYGKQEEYIAKVISILSDNPTATVNVQSHSADSGEFNFQLYSSVRQTEELVNHFVQNGISEDRIFITGLGNLFPLKKAFIQSRVDANQMNKRVIFNIQNIETPNITIEASELSKNSISKEYKNYKNSISELSYSIEIAKTQQLFKHEDLEILESIKIEKIDDFYHYSTGSYQSFAEAKKSLVKIKKYNFPTSKIIAYISGNRIANSDFSTQLKNYPDLADYIIESYSNK